MRRVPPKHSPRRNDQANAETHMGNGQAARAKEHMSGAEIALIITAIGSLFGVLFNAQKISQLKEDGKRIGDENEELKEEVERNRQDIISLGEHYAGMSKDVGTLVILVNKLYNDYSKDTGHRPDIDWAVLDRALTIQHKTNPLGPLQFKE